MAKQINIVLVHGAWADGSSWSKVIQILKKSGFNVTATQNALTSLEDDVEICRRLAEQQDGHTLLVAHSYGGCIITEAAHRCPNVVGLVYISAFAPEVGESVSILGSLGPPPPGFAAVRPDKYGFLWMDKEMFAASFCADVDPQEAIVMAAAQHPTAAKCFDGKISNAGWKELPSWCQVSENDQMIPAPAEKFMAERIKAKATVSLPTSHVPMVSRPQEVAEIIMKAAKEVLNFIPAATA
jgi:pimeloyl-ACP methyl ester carboxylesterase